MAKNNVKRRSRRSDEKATLSMNAYLCELGLYLCRSLTSNHRIEEILDAQPGSMREIEACEVFHYDKKRGRFLALKPKVKHFKVEDEWYQRHKQLCPPDRVHPFDCLLASRMWANVDEGIELWTDDSGKIWQIKSLPTLRAFMNSYVLRFHFSGNQQGWLEINCSNVLPHFLEVGVSNSDGGTRRLPSCPGEMLETDYCFER